MRASHELPDRLHHASRVAGPYGVLSGWLVLCLTVGPAHAATRFNDVRHLRYFGGGVSMFTTDQ